MSDSESELPNLKQPASQRYPLPVLINEIPPNQLPVITWKLVVFSVSLLVAVLSLIPITYQLNNQIGYVRQFNQECQWVVNELKSKSKSDLSSSRNKCIELVEQTRIAETLYRAGMVCKQGYTGVDCTTECEPVPAVYVAFSHLVYPDTNRCGEIRCNTGYELKDGSACVATEQYLHSLAKQYIDGRVFPDSSS